MHGILLFTVVAGVFSVILLVELSGEVMVFELVLNLNILIHVRGVKESKHANTCMLSQRIFHSLSCIFRLMFIAFDISWSFHNNKDFLERALWMVLRRYLFNQVTPLLSKSKILCFCFRCCWILMIQCRYSSAGSTSLYSVLLK